MNSIKEQIIIVDRMIVLIIFYSLKSSVAALSQSNQYFVIVQMLVEVCSPKPFPAAELSCVLKKYWAQTIHLSAFLGESTVVDCLVSRTRSLLSSTSHGKQILEVNVNINRLHKLVKLR